MTISISFVSSLQGTKHEPPLCEIRFAFLKTIARKSLHKQSKMLMQRVIVF